MDSTGLVMMDQQALYLRRGGGNPLSNGSFPTTLPPPQSMTLQQQQQLLNLLNAHAGGGTGAGAAAGAASGLGFWGAHGNGTAHQVQPHAPPHSYGASTAPAPLIAAHPPLPRPAYSSMPAPRLQHHQHSNPPLLPLPFSRSSSLPAPGPAGPHAGPPRKPPSQLLGARPSAVGAKEQQKGRPGKASTAPAAAARPKKPYEPSAAAKVDVAKQPPSDPIATAADNKKAEVALAAAATTTGATEGAAAAKERKGGVHRLPGTRSAADSTGFSVYSLAPHPSSLPLPRLISLRPPKAAPIPASCNAEALGGVGRGDAAEGPGATTDDLRRLLRL